MKQSYFRLRKYMDRYPGGIAWRIKKHCEVLDTHINNDEEILYIFAGQKNDSFTNIFQTCVVCLTSKRILIAQKGILWGYHLNSITPDMFNDMEIHMELIWGRIVIDTIKEVVTISNLSKKALPEIETEISTFMMKEKKKYAINKEI